MFFKEDSKKQQRSLEWFQKTGELESIPVKWEDLVKYNLPPGIIEKMREWEHISKSPYSNSFYSSSEVTFKNKPHGSMRVSDHWNFHSRRDNKLHGRTSESVENNILWCIGVFDSEKKEYVITYKDYDLTYLKEQEFKKKRNEYMKDPNTIARKRFFAGLLDKHEILVEMIYKGWERNGVLHKYTGTKIAILDPKRLWETHPEACPIASQILYSNGELEMDNVEKLLFKTISGEILDNPYIIPEHLKKDF